MNGSVFDVILIVTSFIWLTALLYRIFLHPLNFVSKKLVRFEDELLTDEQKIKTIKDLKDNPLGDITMCVTLGYAKRLIEAFILCNEQYMYLYADSLVDKDDFKDLVYSQSTEKNYIRVSEPLDTSRLYTLNKEQVLRIIVSKVKPEETVSLMETVLEKTNNKEE